LRPRASTPQRGSVRRSWMHCHAAEVVRRAFGTRLPCRRRRHRVFDFGRGCRTPHLPRGIRRRRNRESPPGNGGANSEDGTGMCFPVVTHLRESRSQQHEPAHASAPAAPADGQLASRAGRCGWPGVWMLGRDPSQFFSHRLRVLEQRSLVGRTRDPSDGRGTMVTVTDAGRRLLRDRDQVVMDALVRTLVQSFTVSQRQRLHSIAPLLNHLADSL